MSSAAWVWGGPSRLCCLSGRHGPMCQPPGARMRLERDGRWTLTWPGIGQRPQGWLDSFVLDGVELTDHVGQVRFEDDDEREAQLDSAERWLDEQRERIAGVLATPYLGLGEPREDLRRPREQGWATPPCREMPTRSCPADGCAGLPCARYEDDDASRWPFVISGGNSSGSRG